MKFFKLGSVLASVGLSLFTGLALADITASSIFETIPSGKGGSCEGMDINTMVNDAARLNTRAIQVLEMLIRHGFKKGSQDEQFAWMAWAIWGISFFNTPTGSVAVRTNDLKTLKKVKGVRERSVLFSLPFRIDVIDTFLLFFFFREL